MGRGIGGSGRGGGSGKVRISGRGGFIHAGRGKHFISSKEKAESGLSKSLGNSMFIYGGKTSAD